jgi:hypothetical protein
MAKRKATRRVSLEEALAIRRRNKQKRREPVKKSLGADTKVIALLVLRCTPFCTPPLWNARLPRLLRNAASLTYRNHATGSNTKVTGEVTHLL